MVFGVGDKQFGGSAHRDSLWREKAGIACVSVCIARHIEAARYGSDLLCFDEYGPDCMAAGISKVKDLPVKCHAGRVREPGVSANAVDTSTLGGAPYQEVDLHGCEV